MIRKTLTVSCEGGDPIDGNRMRLTGCEATFIDREGIQDARSMRAAANRKGWAIVDSRDYCPRHAPIYRRVGG